MVYPLKSDCQAKLANNYQNRAILIAGNTHLIFEHYALIKSKPADNLKSSLTRMRMRRAYSVCSQQLY